VTGALLVLAVVIVGLGIFRTADTSSRSGPRQTGAATLVTSSADGRRASTGGSRKPSPNARPGLTEGRPSPATASEAAVRSVLTKSLTAAGPHAGAFVYDISSGTRLFALRATVKRPPASVEKLWTTTALMLKLGPAARLHTAVLGTGSLRDGVWHGDLYLRGGGDPTFGDPTFNRVWNHGYGSTAAELVGQLVHRGIRAVTGSVYADESLFDRRRGGLLTDYAPDVPDFGGQLSALTYDHGSTAPHFSPATFAAHEFVLVMRGSHIAAQASTHTETTPRGARLLAIVSSPPMSVMARLMDVPSDDLFAEMFTKQLGVLFGGGGTISAGAHVIAQTITENYDLHPGILDGSGLSRDDGSSPLEVVDLLRELWGSRVGRELVDSLPTVGVSGTVQTIAVKTAAQGHCVAKTGTLDDVTNLAGYCGGRGHQALAFALFVDGPANWSALALESQMVAAIARY
jgi:serine-type D-Ala-D-Ala carboxypeptidase/endopeptidase (penicillin-binding protein 4)